MMSRSIGYYISPIGVLEIKGWEMGITSVMFVDKVSECIVSSEIVDKCISQLDEYFKGTRRNFDLELSLGGTVFQKRVWEELLNIPFGETISYRELAVRIGNEKACRAVGNANGKNVLNIIVPCHRVIGTDKSLTGYGGGLNRKKWLLEYEANGNG